MKIVVLVGLLFLGVRIGVAQSASVGMSLVAAQEAFESGEYEQGLRLLDEFEKLRGTSPRLESLRALTLNELGRKAQALKALRIYFRLTSNRDLSGNPAHQELVKLRDELSKKIDQEFESRKKKLDQERERSAKEFVSELSRSHKAEETRISGSSVSPPANTMLIGGSGQSSPDASKLSVPSSHRMSLAELETWLKISESTDANEYFLFIETFPEGEFVAIARKRMMDIGDPIWNGVRNSYDPFKFRDFINANPDSPFLEPARIRMMELAKIAIEWERISGSVDQAVLKAFENKNPGHPLATEAKSVRAEIAWKELGQAASDGQLEQFIAEFPESPRVTEARANIEKRRKPKESVSTRATNQETKVDASSGIIIRMPGNLIRIDRKFLSSSVIGAVIGKPSSDGSPVAIEEPSFDGSAIFF
jgi:outer membrane protein assembly factor BamD (BamD/ComL family)